MSNAPQSFCELRAWIYKPTNGQALSNWTGNATGPSVDEFTATFAKYANNLGSDDSLPEGLSLDEAKLAARLLAERLIIQAGEVPVGWEDAFAAPPSIAPGLVTFPPYPVRRVDEVRRFMDLQQQRAQDAVRIPLFPELTGREALQDGIKAAWLWLVQEGHTQMPMPPFPEGVALSELFDDVYATVKSAKQSKAKHRNDEPSEADLLVGRKVLAEMWAGNPSVETFRNAVRAKGHKGSDTKFGKVFKTLKLERQKK